MSETALSEFHALVEPPTFVRELDLPDWRLLERVIGLTNRLGCAYASVEALVSDGRCTAKIAFTGPQDALRRLDLQLTRLLNDDKEMSR